MYFNARQLISIKMHNYMELFNNKYICINIQLKKVTKEIKCIIILISRFLSVDCHYRFDKSHLRRVFHRCDYLKARNL